MFIVIILFIVLVELFFIPVTETNLIIVLVCLIILMVLLEILFPRSRRGVRKLSQKKLKELFAIRSVRLGFGYNPENLPPEKLTLFSQQPNFEQGAVIRLPFSYESNLSAYVDFSRNVDLPHGKAMLSGVSDPVIRAELLCQERRPVPLRGPEQIEGPKDVFTERFFLDRSVASCNKCKIQGYAIILSTKSDYAIYRFPSLTIDLAKRRVSSQEESS